MMIWIFFAPETIVNVLAIAAFIFGAMHWWRPGRTTVRRALVVLGLLFAFGCLEIAFARAGLDPSMSEDGEFSTGFVEPSSEPDIQRMQARLLWLLIFASIPIIAGEVRRRLWPRPSSEAPAYHHENRVGIRAILILVAIPNAFVLRFPGLGPLLGPYNAVIAFLAVVMTPSVFNARLDWFRYLAVGTVLPCAAYMLDFVFYAAGYYAARVGPFP